MPSRSQKVTVAVLLGVGFALYLFLQLTAIPIPKARHAAASKDQPARPAVTQPAVAESPASARDARKAAVASTLSARLPTFFHMASVQWTLCAVPMLLCLIPPLRRLLAALLGWLADPSPLRRRLTTLLLFAAATGYLYFTAARQGRDFQMRTQDEMMNLVQIQQLAHGRLWMPAHPEADFFRTLEVLAKPVYASMYFPGAQLFFVPSVWFGLPVWAIALAIAGAVVALTYRVVGELLDYAAGLLAALLLVALPVFRYLSIEVMTYLPMVLLSLLTAWAYLRWRKAAGHRLGWAALLGILLGWAAITRPADAVCLALPLGVALCLDLFRGPGRLAPDTDTPPPPTLPRPRGNAWATLALIAVAALPLLSLQLIADKGITGHWLQTPVALYQQTVYPDVHILGYHPWIDKAHPPHHDLPLFQSYHEGFARDLVLRRIPRIVAPAALLSRVGEMIPTPLLALLLPVGLLGLTDRRRIALWCFLPLMALTYRFVFPFISLPYMVLVAPVVLLTVLLGRRVVVETWFAARPAARQWLNTSLALALATVAVAGLPEVQGAKDKSAGSIAMQKFNQLERDELKTPAVVFFRCNGANKNAWKAEQTYNFAALNIDDEPVIRAQDLGRRDIELARYYAALQPGRLFYLFDPETVKLTRLGTAAELAADPARLPPPTPTPTTRPEQAPANSEDADPDAADDALRSN